MDGIRRSGGGPIVVAVDRSEHAHLATEWAAELAAALGSPLHLVHVVSPGAPGGDEDVNRLGMLRVAAWRAGVDPDRITTVRGSLTPVMADLAQGARLVVLGVDLSAHPEVETDTVRELVGRTSSPVAVVRCHRPGLGAPLRGPVVVAGGAVVPAFAAEVAARLGALVETVDLVAEDAPVSRTALLDRAHGARLIVFDPSEHRTATASWLDEAGRVLIEQATCPVVVLGAVDQRPPARDLNQLASASR